MNIVITIMYPEFMHWFIDPVKEQYADFTGRVGRQEFWMFILVYIGIAVVVSAVTTMIRMPALYTLFGLAVMVPCWAITARRLHDVNKSGWWQLIALIPLVGIILLIVWLAGESKNEGNQFGDASVAATIPDAPVTPEAPVADASEEVKSEAETPEDSQEETIEESAPVEVENTKQGFGN